MCSAMASVLKVGSLLLLQLHSYWPPSSCSRADTSSRGLMTEQEWRGPSSPLRLFRLSCSWCAFCLVPNDSCDGTVMLCDHTGPQPSLLSAGASALLVPPSPSRESSPHRPWSKLAPPQISFHRSSWFCKICICVHIYLCMYICVWVCRHKLQTGRPSG